MKKRIQEVVVVEGKTDTAVLKELYDVDTIETSGSGINDEIMTLIKTAARTRGVIVLTDPDYPGQQIRHKIEAAVPEAKHAFVAKKDARGDKKLGIAEAKKEAIVEALNQAVTFTQASQSITYPEFIALGIIGDKKKRLHVYEALHLGYGNAKTLFKRLNMIGATYQDVADILDSFE